MFPRQQVFLIAAVSSIVVGSTIYSQITAVVLVGAFTTPTYYSRPPVTTTTITKSSEAVGTTQATTKTTLESINGQSVVDEIDTTTTTTTRTSTTLLTNATEQQQSKTIFGRHYPQSKSSLKPGEFVITYLEINGFLITTSNGVTVLIDPILEGDLDFFGLTDLYSAKKKTLPSTGLIDLLPPHIDCLLLTQGLNDHAHVRTLSAFAQSRIITNVTTILAPPSARPALEESGLLNPTTTNKSKVKFLKHGETFTVVPSQQSSKSADADASTATDTTSPSDNDVAADHTPSAVSRSRCDGLEIRATKGALVGPPWQARENGYILRPTTATTHNKRRRRRLPFGSSRRDDASSRTTTTTSTEEDCSSPSIYIEPHVEFDVRELQRLGHNVDVVISPIEGQRIASTFDLVFGSDRTVELVKTLRPKLVIPMTNGNVDASGPVSSIVSTSGSEQEFRSRLVDASSGIISMAPPRIEKLTPGEDRLIKL